METLLNLSNGRCWVRRDTVPLGDFKDSSKSPLGQIVRLTLTRTCSRKPIRSLQELGKTSILDVRGLWKKQWANSVCIMTSLSSTGLSPGGGPGAPLPPPLCEMMLSCLYYSGGEKSQIRRINTQYIFSGCFVAPPPQRALLIRKNITSRGCQHRGCQHTHLVSTMGVIQCDPSPLKNRSYAPEN